MIIIKKILTGQQYLVSLKAGWSNHLTIKDENKDEN